MALIVKKKKKLLFKIQLEYKSLCVPLIPPSPGFFHLLFAIYPVHFFLRQILNWNGLQPDVLIKTKFVPISS